MNGAIFYSSKYGSTAQYAQWIAEATGLAAFDMKSAKARPSDFDFIVLGAPVLYNRLYRRDWIRRHEREILGRPAMLYSVSGAGPGEKLDGWVAESLSPELLAHVEHVGLFGRQDPKELKGMDWILLKIAGLVNTDREVAEAEFHGFELMDKESILPIVEWTKGHAAQPELGSAG